MEKRDSYVDRLGKSIMATLKCWQDLFYQTQKLEGDVIILGVGDGVDCIELGKHFTMHNIDKKIYACDCFKGLPYTDEEWGIDTPLHVGECFEGTADDFKKQIDKENLGHIVIPVVGLIEDTLTTIPCKKFCFAWLDMDLYYPTLVAYQFLKDKMSLRGIMGFHDYENSRCIGIKKAVDEVVVKNEEYRRIGERLIFFERNALS